MRAGGRAPQAPGGSHLPTARSGHTRPAATEPPGTPSRRPPAAGTRGTRPGPGVRSLGESRPGQALRREKTPAPHGPTAPTHHGGRATPLRVFKPPRRDALGTWRGGADERAVAGRGGEGPRHRPGRRETTPTPSHGRTAEREDRGAARPRREEPSRAGRLRGGGRDDTRNPERRAAGSRPGRATGGGRGNGIGDTATRAGGGSFPPPHNTRPARGRRWKRPSGKSRRTEEPPGVPAGAEPRSPPGLGNVSRGEGGRSPPPSHSLMILPQVHLRKPCYDFYFL